MKAVQITLIDSATNYNLLALARAIEPAFSADVESLLVEADAANAEGSKISVGDSSISATRYGFQLGPGDSYNFPRGASVGEINLRGSAAGLKLNVTSIPRFL